MTTLFWASWITCEKAIYQKLFRKSILLIFIAACRHAILQSELVEEFGVVIEQIHACLQSLPQTLRVTEESL